MQIQLNDLFNKMIINGTIKPVWYSSMGCIVEKVLPKIDKKGNRTINSYTLKHALECELGGYVSNETVKFIMAVHGAPTRRSKEEYDINVSYPYVGSFDLKTKWTRKRKSKYCRRAR